MMRRMLSLGAILVAIFANPGYNHITGIYLGNVLLAFAAE